MALPSGTKLGPYEIVAPIGAGGMGEVYRTKDTRLGRDVAIKVLPEGFARDADRLRRFEQEARAVAALNHPNILAIHDIGEYNGSPFLVSELLEGHSLREELTGGALPTRRAVEDASQIAQGLAAAHDKGIVHRDLKPENVFVTKDGRRKILDFGLAKLAKLQAAADENATLDTTPQDTSPGMVLGTVGYMSPEQVKGEAADARSDIFALGTILYEMLSGQRPFRRDTSAETMTAILKEDPPELTTSDKPISPRARTNCAALPGEKTAAAFSISEGPGIQSRRHLRKYLHQRNADRPGIRRKAAAQVARAARCGFTSTHCWGGRKLVVLSRRWLYFAAFVPSTDIRTRLDLRRAFRFSRTLDLLQREMEWPACPALFNRP